MYNVYNVFQCSCPTASSVSVMRKSITIVLYFCFVYCDIWKPVSIVGKVVDLVLKRLFCVV